MSMKRQGIDVSGHQGTINWDQVAGNIDFAIIRLGYGQNSLDEQAARNISECNRLGIPYGVYWFSYAYSVERVKNEARNAIVRLKELGGVLSYPFYFDWEYESREYCRKQGYTVSNDLLREMAAAFCGIIEDAGCYAGIYANQDYLKNYFGTEIFQRYALWLADLSGEEMDVNLHQYSFTGKMDGISTKVDMNYCYVDFPAIIAKMDAKQGEAEEVVMEPEATNTMKGDFIMEMRTLKKGCTGEDVRALQILLIGNGYSCGELGADGDFGAATENAVEAYQEDNDLTVDGIAGKKTMSSLLGC